MKIAKTKILAVSGSLRAASSNSILVRAVAALAPEAIEVNVYDKIGELPHFNPDLDGEGIEAPPPVADFRRALKAADAVLISSPEYAHGVPGALKNALDWVVSSGETVGKPFALVNANSRAVHARAQLYEILKTMAANVVSVASITIALQKNKNVDEAAIIADAEISDALRASLVALARAVGEQSG